MNYYDNTLAQLNLLKRMQFKMERRMRQLPEGRLVRKHSKGKTYFYVEKDGRLRSLLGRKWEQELFLEKEYIHRTLQKLEHNIPLVEILERQYQPVADWNNVWETLGNSENSFKHENQKHLYGGLYYRSKSEMMIAVMLTSYGIEFKYESAITLSGKKLYPDFAVKRPKDGQIIFWEHFGRTDLDNYREDMYERIEKYRASGIDVWDRLVMTFETEDGAIDADKIDRLIKVFIIR